MSSSAKERGKAGGALTPAAKRCLCACVCLPSRAPAPVPAVHMPEQALPAVCAQLL